MTRKGGLARARTLRVYGWQGWRYEIPVDPGRNKASREIVAAPSKAAVRAMIGRPGYEITETGNRREIEQAMSEPGVIFWAPLDEALRPGVRWNRAKPAIRKATEGA